MPHSKRFVDIPAFILLGRRALRNARFARVGAGFDGQFAPSSLATRQTTREFFQAIQNVRPESRVEGGKSSNFG